MNVNWSQIRQEFYNKMLKEYEEKIAYSNQKYADTSLFEEYAKFVEMGDSIAIYTYEQDFKDFLKQNGYADSSIDSKNINSILLMDVENGKLTDTDASLYEENLITEAQEAPKEDETPSDIEEAQTFLSLIDDDTQSEEELPDSSIYEKETTVKISKYGIIETKKTINLTNEDIDNYKSKRKLLSDMYLDEDVIAVVDTDGDNIISDEEREKFESYIKGDKDKIELKDIKEVLKSIKDEEFNLVEYYKFDAEKAKTKDKDNKTPSSSSSSGSGGSYSGGVQRDPSDINQMTVDELKVEQQKRQSTYNKAQNELKGVYNGQNSEVKTAQKALEDAKENYAKALEGESDEVKSQIEQLENERSETLKQIETTQKSIDETNIQIIDYQSELSGVKASIATCDSSISALNSALSSYPDNPDSKEQTEVEQAKADIQAQISQLEAQKAQLEAQQSALEENISNANVMLSDLQTTQMPALTDSYNQISAQMENIVSEDTKEALEALKLAKDNIALTRKRQAQSIKSKTLEPAQKELDEINQMLDKKQSEQTRISNSYANPEKVVEFVRNLKNQGLNIAQLRQKMNNAGVDFHDGLYCGDFVYYAFKEILGDNMPEWYKNAHYQSAQGTVSAGRSYQVGLNEAQAGDIVVYDWNGDGIGDHVAIFTGYSNGQVTSIEGNTEQGMIAECTRRSSAVMGIYSTRV